MAKYYASLGGHRVVHTAAHLHGGMGVDRDYPLHRYFLLAKQLELTFGGASRQAGGARRHPRRRGLAAVSGPLDGVRVVEIAGSDRRRSRRWCWPTSAPRCSASTAPKAAGRRPASPCRTGAGAVGGRPQAPRRSRRRPAADRRGRRGVRGLPARRGRATRHRSRAVPRAQPAPRLRPDDRLGTGRADGRRGRPRHRLHRARGRARAARSRRTPPTPPINLLGDFAGAGMLLALGVCAAAAVERATGKGQVIDAAMVDGAARC